VRFNVAFRVKVPETPCNVRVWLPVPALLATVMVTVADCGLVPSSVTVDVDTEHVIFAVPPVQDNAVSPVKPSIEETVIVVAPE
jgi:hypothetical protein